MSANVVLSYIVAVSSFGDVVNAIGETRVGIATIRKLLVIGVPFSLSTILVYYHSVY